METLEGMSACAVRDLVCNCVREDEVPKMRDRLDNSPDLSPGIRARLGAIGKRSRFYGLWKREGLLSSVSCLRQNCSIVGARSPNSRDCLPECDIPYAAPVDRSV